MKPQVILRFLYFFGPSSGHLGVLWGLVEDSPAPRSGVST